MTRKKWWLNLFKSEFLQSEQIFFFLETRSRVIHYHSERLLCGVDFGGAIKRTKGAPKIK